MKTLLLGTARDRRIKHGESAPPTKEWKTWRRMNARCYTKSTTLYHRYGGRGIRVCRRWRHNYKNFLRDMGRAPSAKHSLDRIKNGLNYTPTNCRWLTHAEQQSNRDDNVFLSWRGKRQTVMQWSREIGLCDETIYNRIRLGWITEKILSTPSRKSKVAR